MIPPVDLRAASLCAESDLSGLRADDRTKARWLAVGHWPRRLARAGIPLGSTPPPGRDAAPATPEASRANERLRSPDEDSTPLQVSSGPLPGPMEGELASRLPPRAAPRRSEAGVADRGTLFAESFVRIESASRHVLDLSRSI